MSSEVWKTWKIGEIGKIITGKTPPTQYAENFGNKYPFITPRDMLGQKRVDQTERYLSEKGKNTVKNCLLPVNAICVSCIGSDLGKVVMTTTNSITNQQLNSIICKDLFDPNFIYYALVNIYGKLRNIGHNSTAVPIINKSDFSNFEILVPDISTQRHIAEILSAMDNKIELNRQTNTTLEAIAQAIFKEWFVNFNFPGATGEMVESELGLIPKGWRVAKLGEVSDLLWGDTTTTKRRYTTEGYLAYSASGPDGYLPYYDFSRQGIVVSAIGAYSGKTWFAQGNWSCIKNTIRFWSIDDDISNEYLFLYTSGKDFWPLRGSAQPFISQTDAREIKIIYPGNHLSSIFGGVIQPVFKLIRRNDDESITFSHTRDSLLPKLMNGEIDVNVID